MITHPTPRESAAAQRLAEAIIEFLVAMEAGRAKRAAAVVPDAVLARRRPLRAAARSRSC